MSTHGRHIRVVGYGDPSALGSVRTVEQFLKDVVHAVGMRPLAAPQMHDVALDLAKMNVEPFEDEGGVKGVVVLSTSHCSIHTWPLRSYFVADLYSCRDFSDLKMLECLRRLFDTKQLRVSDLSFSLEPPSLSDSESRRSVVDPTRA